MIADNARYWVEEMHVDGLRFDQAHTMKHRGKPVLRRWIRRGLVLWAGISTLWVANSYRTRGVAVDTLRSSPTVSVMDRATMLEFMPTRPDGKPALIFICGSGVSAHAYAPLLRPIADVGYPVFVVKLPYRFAPFESHKQAAVVRACSVISAHPAVSRWVISGHSLGGALACRVVQSDPKACSAMVLVGTTHPKQGDLSSLPMPVTKVYASNDGVAPPNRILSNQGRLPKATQWVEIKGGNHSQFGHYGHQLFDGKATISRETQQAATRAALLEVLANAAK
jgi:pimeloyl-ACP methyl ester carboxylesterase